MSNPNMESIVKELLELKRMKEELEAEITAMEDLRQEQTRSRQPDARNPAAD